MGCTQDPLVRGARHCGPWRERGRRWSCGKSQEGPEGSAGEGGTGQMGDKAPAQAWAPGGDKAADSRGGGSGFVPGEGEEISH